MSREAELIKEIDEHIAKAGGMYGLELPDSDLMVIRVALMEKEDARSKKYPILSHPGETIPWSLVEKHRGQAMNNHSQTIERLAERGGLCYLEMLATLTDTRLYDVRIKNISEDSAKRKVLQIVKEYEEGKRIC